MSDKLKTHVTVHDENGLAHTFGPSDTLPGWARKSITNPHVWADEASAESVAGAPPRNGPGSGKGAWAVYAETIGLTVPEGASTKDIQAIVDGAAEPSDAEDDEGDEGDEESDSDE